MLVRTATEAAPGSQENEDRVFHVGNIVGVLDGVTQPSDLDSGCVHGVGWYVDTLSRRLREAADQAPQASLTDILASAIAQTVTDHGGVCDLTNPGTPAATVGLIRARAGQLDYLLLCDTYLVTDDGSEVAVLTDPRFEHAIAAIRRDHLDGDNDFGSHQHWTRLRDATTEKYRLTNTDDGYWIAAADPAAAHHAVTGILPLAGERAVRRAALLTDGASRAVDTFALFGWRELLDNITDEGPEAVIRRIRAAEALDTNAAARPRFKRHDDATVALCQFR